MRIFFLILAIAILVSVPGVSLGTHLRAGEIQVRRLDCRTLTFEITLIIFVNTNTGTPVGGDDDFLSFGDGTRLLVRELPREIIEPALAIGRSVFKIQHTYAGSGHYLISYNEPNRNEGVVNMNMSVATRFQIEAMIAIEDGKCNNAPIFLSPPIDRACLKSAFFHNPGGFDPEGDSLSYELAIPKKDDTTPVTNYRNPNHSSFYSSFSLGNEAGTGPPIFQIDPVTGLLTWDAPGSLGEYTIAIKMREWKKDTIGIWYEAGYIIRDMQIVVSECDNRKPLLIVPQEICVIAGDPVEIQLRATDPDGDSVRIQFFSELFQIALYQPEVIPASNVGTFKPSPLEVMFRMQTSCAHVRNTPYLLTVKVTDRTSRSAPLSQYYTIKISIIAPPPKLESVVVNPVSKQVSLAWSIPNCENVETFQVWRRTSSIEYDQTACSKGMPEGLRYDLLAVVPHTQKTFIDNSLEIGSQYCYRIVAVVTGNNPGKLSIDTCLIPKPAEAPVITNVSIEETDISEGSILVKWTAPFEIDKSQYPPPYHYQILRKNETLDTPFERIGESQTDTTFIDGSLNTSEYAYRYSVELYVKTLSNLPLDSSSQASSIVATSDSKVDQIDIRWTANIPWSNYAASHPYHLVFRSASKNGPFDLIDSVNVITNGFVYEDRGRYQNAGLTRDPYFYKIEARGTYGNPAVADPLKNLSPIVIGQLLDTIPPCAPIVQIEPITCAQFPCDGKSYYTSLHWDSPDVTCDEDVVRYEVLVKSDTAQVYTSLGLVTQPTYRHSNLTNLDYCYRIISIDHIGNRSDSSAAICNTSCLSFKLPNVITPGTLDEKNDFLATYDGGNSSEAECARSVKRVELIVYNRWGQEIYLKEINSQETNILWPGVSNSGAEVSAGTYYYKAKVNFQTNDTSKRTQEVKGWVHVLR